MTKKINQILLIDDNKYDNYYHSRILTFHDLAKGIHVFESGRDAIEFLKTTEEYTRSLNLILLDINMPGFSGWDFLAEYEHLTSLHQTTKIFILTTSINPDDEVSARKYPTISDFLIKPLSIAILKNALLKYSSAIIGS